MFQYQRNSMITRLCQLAGKIEKVRKKDSIRMRQARISCVYSMICGMSSGIEVFVPHYSRGCIPMNLVLTSLRVKSLGELLSSRARFCLSDYCDSAKLLAHCPVLFSLFSLLCLNSCLTLGDNPWGASRSETVQFGDSYRSPEIHWQTGGFG